MRRELALEDFPKLESPFEREKIGGTYQCIPKIRKEYTWVWTEDCLATEKLDGTNVSAYIVNGNIKVIMNRKNIIDIWRSNKMFFEGVYNALSRKYIVPEQFEEIQIFGELIGPKINGNPYKLQEHIWYPFSYIKRRYCFKFWKDFIKDCKGKGEQEIFDLTSNLFKCLWSIFKRQRNMKGEVNENVGFKNSVAAEGIVFYNIKTGQICKLRRDMFGWYKGRRHKGGK